MSSSASSRARPPAVSILFENEFRSFSLSLAQNGLRVASEYLAKAANDNLVRSPTVVFENGAEHDIVSPRENSWNNCRIF